MPKILGHLYRWIFRPLNFKHIQKITQFNGRKTSSCRGMGIFGTKEIEPLFPMGLLQKSSRKTFIFFFSLKVGGCHTSTNLIYSLVKRRSSTLELAIENLSLINFVESKPTRNNQRTNPWESIFSGLYKELIFGLTLFFFPPKISFVPK